MRGLRERVERLEKRLIFAALRESKGNQSGAARSLKLSERILRYKMKKYGLEIHTKLSQSYKIVEIDKS